SLDRREDVEARATGDVEIEENERWRAASDRIESRASVGGLTDIEPLPLQHHAERSAHRRVVLDQEDPGGHQALRRTGADRRTPPRRTAADRPASRRRRRTGWGRRAPPAPRGRSRPWPTRPSS